MKLIIDVSKDDALNYIAIQGLDKSKENEQMATNAVCKIFEAKMLTRVTLNNWKGNVLLIRYATNAEELSILFEAIKSDVRLQKDHDERSLLY